MKVLTKEKEKDASASDVLIAIAAVTLGTAMSLGGLGIYDNYGDSTPAGYVQYVELPMDGIEIAQIAPVVSLPEFTVQ